MRIEIIIILIGGSASRLGVSSPTLTLIYDLRHTIYTIYDLHYDFISHIFHARVLKIENCSKVILALANFATADNCFPSKLRFSVPKIARFIEV